MDPFSAIGRKIGETGTFFRRFVMDGAFRTGVIEGGLDYVASLIHNVISGKPAPYITYHHGGFMVHNSYMADHSFMLGYEMGNNRGGAVAGFTRGGVAHVGVGASRGVARHEAGHIRQFQTGGIGQFAPFVEITNELAQGTMGYSITAFPMYRVLGLDGFKAMAAYNIGLFEADIFSWMIFSQTLSWSDSQIEGTYGSDRAFWDAIWKTYLQY